MPNPVTTDIEKQLDALMSVHGTPDIARALQERLKELTMHMQSERIPYEILAYALAQHAAAAVASMKMAGIIRPQLADLLGRDFAETIQRANPGAHQLASKQ